jgi:hypothetical protein
VRANHADVGQSLYQDFGYQMLKFATFCLIQEH